MMQADHKTDRFTETMCNEFNKLVVHHIGFGWNRQTSKRDARLIQGTFTSQFYLFLDSQIRTIIPELPLNYWKSSSILDCGSGTGLALFGFNFILQCQHLYGIEIQEELTNHCKVIADTLIKHNCNRSNWATLETITCSVADRQTAEFYSSANFIITMNLKFDAETNDGMSRMITRYSKPGTIVLALMPLTGQRRPVVKVEIKGVLFTFLTLRYFIDNMVSDV